MRHAFLVQTAVRLLALTLLPIAAGTALAQQGDTIRLAEIQVVGSATNLARISGTATLIAPAHLRLWNSPTTNDVLRRVPGLFVREEEGLGLRPNIGVRGLNPTRSTKVLLLEDGVPLTFAPYGDNATYYHPPVARFERVEVLRGAGQILFGPQTVGGVINYITPRIPTRPSVEVAAAGGSRGFVDVLARAGGELGRAGALVSFDRRQSDGSRDNVATTLDDLTMKVTLALSERHALTLRGNGYRERSNVTYSGLTEAEWESDPRQNPFRNDSMLLNRYGASLMHRWLPMQRLQLTSTVYATGVSRDWWRQSSNSGERPNDRSDPACSGLANLSTTCGNQGRLRDYQVFGIEPRVRAQYSLFGLASELDAGARWHTERQDRLQVNGSSPLARQPGAASDPNSGTVESNLRTNQAWSGFVHQRVMVDDWTIVPGVRIEHVRYRRTNRLANPKVTGDTKITRVIPGIGTTFRAAESITFFAGAHRGFSRPRTEDIIDNTTGGVVELDPELSLNYEVGVRASVGTLNLEAAGFRLDFDNQVIPASVAGGTGGALTNGGRTMHQGFEIGGRLDLPVSTMWRPYLDGAFTWVPTARFEGERYVFVGTGGGDVIGKVYAAQNAGNTRERVSVTDRRLPYAPKVTYAFALGYGTSDLLDLRIELHGVSQQYSDALNTTTTVADGQQGLLPAYSIWNASAMYRFAPTRSTILSA